jgi:hypothetical protein
MHHCDLGKLTFRAIWIPLSQIGNLPTLLFGPEMGLKDRYVDPEVQGGKIALIAVKQARVQKPPNFLDRMRSTFSTQVAYNERIMKAEEDISGVNCDVADFVSQMSLDPAEEVIICVNGPQEMKKGETAMAGQLWIQGDRMMTAANPAFPGMPNSKEAAILSATAEALEWRNDALEQSNPPRKGQRVIIYPKDLWGLEEVLATGDPNADAEDGHEIAYQQVFASLGKKMSQRSVPRSPSAPGLRKATGGAPGTRSGAVPESPMPDSVKQAVEPKAVAPQRASADQPKGAKAPPPTKGQVKGQESPVAKATHPIASRRRKASGAGGLRGVDGSGQTQVCGHVSPPSKPGS